MNNFLKINHPHLVVFDKYCISPENSVYFKRLRDLLLSPAPQIMFLAIEEDFTPFSLAISYLP
jgi:hypothetical protein